MRKLKALLLLFATSAAIYAQTYSVTLAWDAPLDTPGVTIAGYRIYESANNATPVKIEAGNVLTYQVTGLQAGVSYSFTAAAVSTELLEGDPSNVVVYSPQVTPTAPPAIPEIPITAIGFGGFSAGSWTSVLFTWAPLDPAKYQFLNYQLRLYNEQTGVTTTYSTPLAFYSVPSLPRGSYRVFVTATNFTGTSPMLTYAYISGQSPKSPKVTLTTP